MVFAGGNSLKVMVTPGVEVVLSRADLYLQFNPELVLISSGFDSAEGDPLVSLGKF